MKRITWVSTLFVAGAILTFAATRSSASVTYIGTTFGGVSSPPTVSTAFGTVVDAVNFGGSALSRDGINYAAYGPLSGASSPQTVHTSPLNISFSATSSNLSTIDLGDDPLFGTVVYGNTASSSISLFISGLNSARTYQVQFLHGDPRDGAPYNSTPQVFTDSTGSSIQQALQFNTTNPTNSFAIMTVQVSGATSLQYDMPDSGVLSPTFSGVVVEIAPVPEPSSFVLISCATIALSRFYRRNRR